MNHKAWMMVISVLAGWVRSTANLAGAMLYEYQRLDVDTLAVKFSHRDAVYPLSKDGVTLGNHGVCRTQL